jgi:hypothetical protein
MKKQIKVTIAEDGLTPLQRDIMEAGLPEFTQEEMKEKMVGADIAEIVLDPQVVEELKKMGVSVDQFVKEFKEGIGIEET